MGFANGHGVLTLESTYPFGKHRGKHIVEILYNDPQYLQWVYKNKVLKLDKDVLTLAFKDQYQLKRILRDKGLYPIKKDRQQEQKDKTYILTYKKKIKSMYPELKSWMLPLILNNHLTKIHNPKKLNLKAKDFLVFDEQTKTYI